MYVHSPSLLDTICYLLCHVSVSPLGQTRPTGNSQEDDKELMSQASISISLAQRHTKLYSSSRGDIKTKATMSNIGTRDGDYIKLSSPE